MSAPRRVLVSGATGTVGRQVVRALGDSRGITVRVGMRSPEASHHAIETVALDFDDPATLDSAFAGVDAFFFVSPLVEHQEAQADRVLRAASRAGVRQCVRLSSRATEWDDVCVLRRWHRTIEAAIVASGMDYTILRPCSFMQNLLGPHVELARETGVFSIPLGTGRIPFVDARDIGEAAARCFVDAGTHRGKTYVLTGTEALDGSEIAAVLAGRLGRYVRYVPTPHEAARHNGALRGMPDWLVESGLRVYARAESGEEAAIDPELGRLIGRAPTSFAACVARSVAV